MPSTPSAIKRLKQSKKRRLHNRITKKIIKTMTKRAMSGLVAKEFEKAEADFPLDDRQDRQGRGPAGASPEHRRSAEEPFRPRIRRGQGQSPGLNRVRDLAVSFDDLAELDSGVVRLPRLDEIRDDLIAASATTMVVPNRRDRSRPRPGSNLFRAPRSRRLEPGGHAQGGHRRVRCPRDGGMLRPGPLASANPLEIDDILKQARVAMAIKSLRPLQNLARWASTRR